ncbi:hypothetical protein A2239_03730 [Candidatus Uhrbacteria bacterium RIFOXYA2_FULL_40_9]|nr:MAG: hypothetical protein A2239_03730 [Candidatus Uhrbacteria bacterium RIFOXYA2_FULL_40_9]OGL98063.1 MAG: hypothetical protein A2332_01635 [Candidatus Uhrbacteria bacterium RIFOXYB2_FULL_41_18]HBK35189.1 hypothetical protein [Candidatus Uhrbacteria bacterium]HCB55992.1 hypothetical protein [Candidatus Uhrbacteria bacterium]
MFGATEEKKGTKGYLILSSVIVLFLILVSVWSFFFAGKISFSSDYQAVFLDNGQVYFGAIFNENTDYYRLTDVYYLQSGYNMQADSDVALVKLGKEMHGPEDEMFISKQHILFIEDLTEESKVVQAIQTYKKQ